MKDMGRNRRHVALLFVLNYVSMFTTSIQSLQSDIIVATDPKLKVEVKNILIDNNNKKIYFTTINNIFSISSDLQSISQEKEWSASETSKINCKKRKKESACENFITILEFDFNNKIFTCGTNVKPACMTLDKDTLKKSDVIEGYTQHIPRTTDGTVVTLFSPPYLFIGMRENQEQGKLLKLKPYGQKILATTKEMFDGFHPDFISAYSYDNYAYFFIREYGYELEKRQVRYSRVARVCKHDSGVKKYGLNKFITMLKTRLQCNQMTKAGTNLYYDSLQNTFELVLKNPALSRTENTVIYGVFSLANNLEMGSAICRYRVKDVQRIFDSSDLYQKGSDGHMRRSAFSKLRLKITRSACHANSSTINIAMRELKELEGPQLLYDDVKPQGGKALFSLPGVSFTTIVVDEVKAKYGSSYESVIFAGTTKGYIYKILVDRNGKGRILGEGFQPFKNSTPINSMKKMDDMIYVGSFDGIASFRVDRCDAYKSSHCRDCYRDPYCSWSTSDDRCVNAAPGTQSEIDENVIDANCQEVRTTSMATTVTTTAQATTIEITTTESSTEASTTSKGSTTHGSDADSGASYGAGVKSYYTEFIIMTILFVLILILLTLMLLKVAQARYRDTIDGDGAGAKKGCHAFCPSSLSKAYMIDRDQSTKKLMKQNPVYKDTTVELNEVTNNGRVNGKVS